MSIIEVIGRVALILAVMAAGGFGLYYAMKIALRVTNRWYLEVNNRISQSGHDPSKVITYSMWITVGLGFALSLLITWLF